MSAGGFADSTITQIAANTGLFHQVLQRQVKVRVQCAVFVHIKQEKHHTLQLQTITHNTVGCFGGTGRMCR